MVKAGGVRRALHVLGQQPRHSSVLAGAELSESSVAVAVYWALDATSVRSAVPFQLAV